MKILSKSRFNYGRQCEKRLWLYKKSSIPLLKVGPELIVVDPKDVIAVVEVKNYSVGDIKNIFKNLNSAKKLNKKIKTYIFVGTFSSNNQYLKLKSMNSPKVDGIFGIWFGNNDIQGVGSLSEFQKHIKKL